MEKPVSIRDVARAAGVSITAVSHALSGKGKLASATRDRIRAVADELRYRPNPLMAALASRAHRSDASVEGTPVAYLTLSAAVPLRDDISRMPTLVGRGGSFGYRVRRYELHQYASARQLSRELEAQGTAGIILGPTFDRSPVLEDFRWGRYPVVVIGSSPHDWPFHHIVEDVGAGVRTAVRRCAELGYHRIGVALSQHEWPLDDDYERHANALGSLAEVGAARIPPWIELFKAPKVASFARWMRRFRPEVVVAFPRLFEWRLKQAGWRIPEDVAFVDLNLTPQATGLAGMEDVRAEVAQHGIEVLDLLIRHHRCGECSGAPIYLVRQRWHSGPSLPERPPRRSPQSGRAG